MKILMEMMIFMIELQDKKENYQVICINPKFKKNNKIQKQLQMTTGI